MILNLGEGDFEQDPKDCAFLKYPGRDILNGLYFDLGENYAFLTQHVPGYLAVAAEVRKHDVPQYEFAEFNGSDIPHCWVIASLGRLVAESAEMIANGE